LNGKEDIPQEISIQLWQISPCCPGTKKPLGDARRGKVSDVLKKISGNPFFETLDKGDIYNVEKIDRCNGRLCP